MMELLSIEIVYKIIDTLQIPDVIKLLKCSKTIYNDYHTLFTTKIEEYRLDQKELHEVIMPKYIQTIEREQEAVDMYMNPAKYRIVPDVRKMVLFDNYLSSHMDLNRISKIDNQTPYTKSLFIKWWYRYFCLNNLCIDAVNYHTDNFIYSLTGINVGSIITLDQLWQIFREHINIDLNFEINEQISVEFCREEYDLIMCPYMVLKNTYRV